MAEAQLCLLLVTLGSVALILAAVLGVSRASRDELELFAAGLEAGVVHGGRTGPWQVEGRLRGRRLRLEQQASREVLSAALDPAPADLVLADSRGLESLARRLGLVPAAPRFPAPGLNVNLVARLGAAAVGGLFQHEPTRRALLDLFEKDGVTELALRDGWLRVTWRTRAPLRQELARLAERLCTLAELCERRELAWRAASGPPQAIEVQASTRTAGDAAACCPYCRDELERAGQEPAGCPSCGTLHHRACLEEAGGCTVFGCPGRAGPGPRSRAPLRG